MCIYLDIWLYYDYIILYIYVCIWWNCSGYWQLVPVLPRKVSTTWYYMFISEDLYENRISHAIPFTCPSYRRLAFRRNFRDVMYYSCTYVHSQHLAAWKYAWWHAFVGSVEDALGGQHNSRTTIIIALPPTRRNGLKCWKFEIWELQ